MNTPAISDLNVQDVASYFVSCEDTCAVYKNLRHVLVNHSNFTKNKVVPILQVLYCGKENDIRILRKKWTEFTARSSDTRDGFCQNLLKAIKNEENVSIKMKSVVKTQQTNKELQDQIDTLLKELATQKNLAVIHNAQLKAQEKDIYELKKNRVMDKQQLDHQRELVDKERELVQQKDELIRVLNMLVAKPTFYGNEIYS